MRNDESEVPQVRPCWTGARGADLQGDRTTHQFFVCRLRIDVDVPAPGGAKTAEAKAHLASLTDVFGDLAYRADW
jgi:hypothetical protein